MGAQPEAWKAAWVDRWLADQPSSLQQCPRRQPLRPSQKAREVGRPPAWHLTPISPGLLGSPVSISTPQGCPCVTLLYGRSFLPPPRGKHEGRAPSSSQQPWMHLHPSLLGPSPVFAPLALRPLSTLAWEWWPVNHCPWRFRWQTEPQGPAQAMFAA